MTNCKTNTQQLGNDNVNQVVFCSDRINHDIKSNHLNNYTNALEGPMNATDHRSEWCGD